MRATSFPLKDAHLVGGAGLIWASRTPAGPATLRIRAGDTDSTDARSSKEESVSTDAASTEYLAEAWGPGAEWMIEQAPRLIGSDDDTSDFVAHDDAVRTAVRANPGFRIGRTDRVLDALVPAVLGQKVQAKLAKESLRKLMWFHGERAPGPFKAWLLPTAADLAALPYHDWHQINVERKRARIIRMAASRAVRLEECVGMNATDAMTRLQAFPGIGPWTAARVAMTALGDADAVMVGDYHLKNTVSWHLAGEPRATDERMLELLQPYAGHRGRVSMLLKMSGGAPKYGPRLSHIHFEDR